jgi:heat shock protein HspQ
MNKEFYFLTDTIYEDTRGMAMKSLEKMKVSKFNIGDLVTHKKQGYRAVIIDIDSLFQASGRYNPLSTQYEFANKNLWYRLLVDESSQETYVKESLLNIDASQNAINNPLVAGHLTHINGEYHSSFKNH